MKIVIIFFLLLFSDNILSQKKKNEEDKEFHIIEDKYEEYNNEEESSKNKSTTSTESKKVISKDYLKFQQKYSLITINDEYDWFYDKESTYHKVQYGIVNKKGKIILSNFFKYNRGGDSYHKIMNIDNNYGVFNLSDQKWSVPLKYDKLRALNTNFLAAKKNGSFKIIDFNNNIINDNIWGSIEVVSGHKNYLIVSNRNERGENLFGVFNLSTKKLVIPCIYLKISLPHYKENYFKVLDAKSKKYNLITFNNELVFTEWYDKILNPLKGENRFIVRKDNYNGIIDKNNKEIIPVNYLDIKENPYSDGSYFSQNNLGKYGCITIDGKITLPFIYDKLTRSYDNNYLIAYKKNKKGIVKVNNGSPKEEISCVYDDIKIINFSSPKTSFIIAKLNDESILLNTQGEVLNDKKYNDISIIVNKSKKTNYSNINYNFLKVKKKNKYQILGKTGEIVSERIFQDILEEYKKVFIVIIKGKYGLYSLVKNKFLIECKYDLITKTEKGYIGIVNETKINVFEYKKGDIHIKN